MELLKPSKKALLVLLKPVKEALEYQFMFFFM